MTAVIKLYKHIYTGDQRTWFCDGPFTNNYTMPFILNNKLYQSVTQYLLELLQMPASAALPEYMESGYFSAYKNAITEKIVQNLEMKKILLLTGSREITFASMREETMYIALGRNPPEPAVKDGYFHVNASLGPILMEVRTIIAKRSRDMLI